MITVTTMIGMTVNPVKAVMGNDHNPHNDDHHCHDDNDGNDDHNDFNDGNDDKHDIDDHKDHNGAETHSHIDTVEGGGPPYITLSMLLKSMLEP